MPEQFEYKELPEHLGDCCICGEGVWSDREPAEMAYYRETYHTDEEWLVLQEKPQGLCHAQCGLDAGMEQS